MALNVGAKLLELTGRADVGAKEDHPADLQGVDQMGQLGVEGGAVKAHHQALTGQ